ncbi:MFS family permease [Micrococcus sp. UYEF5]|uniref:MFS transporter n=1 Tax=Micrococcus sp. UYEF5 TaxID=1756389 RepID=UPI00339A4A8A
MTSTETSAPAPSRRDWIGLAVLSIGLGLIVLDGTIVGVALPAIIADLHLDLTDAQWVNSLYAVLLLSTGDLADRWGRKRLFLTGLVVFVGGSLLAAAASSGDALIGARAVQAVGAAFIMPSTLSTVNAVFRGRHRAVAFGVWGPVISGASVSAWPLSRRFIYECDFQPAARASCRAETSWTVIRRWSRLRSRNFM